MEFLFVLAVLAPVQFSDSFNLVMSPFTNPAYGQSKNADVYLPAKKINTIGGTLKPFDKSLSQLVFKSFVINRDLSNIGEISADVNFKFPGPSIFGEDYKNESLFGVALYQKRLRPILENNQVLIRMPVFSFSIS